LAQTAVSSAGIFSSAQSRSDGMQQLAWRLYLLSITTSFLVVIEPALCDLIFMIGLVVFGFSRPKTTSFLSGAATTGVLLYLIFSVISLFFVQYNPIGAYRAVLIEFYMIGLFVMTAYYARTRGDEAFRAILLALVIGGVLASIVTVVALLDLIPNSDIFYRGEGVRNRVKATFKDPNVFGPFLVPSILFVTWILVESKRYRFLALGVLGMLLISLVSTFSRGAWVHALFSLMVMAGALLALRSTSRAVFSIILYLAIAICLVVLLFLDRIVAGLADTFFADRLSLQSYDTTRFAFVADATVQILRHPLGIGPVQARFVYGYLPHNTFIAFAMHNGIFACIGLILIYGTSLFRCATKVMDQRPGWTKYALILSVLMGLLVLMMVVGAIHWRHMYVVCGLAFGVYASDRALPEGRLWPRKQVLPTRSRPTGLIFNRPNQANHIGHWSEH